MSSSLHMFHGTYQMLRDPSKDPCARFHLNQSVIMWLFIPPSTDGPIALGQNDRPSKTDSTVVTATPKDGNIQKWFDGSNIWPISLFFSCFFFYDLTHHMSTSHVHITCPHHMSIRPCRWPVMTARLVAYNDAAALCGPQTPPMRDVSHEKWYYSPVN